MSYSAGGSSTAYGSGSQGTSKTRKYCLFCRMDITNLLYFHCASPTCHDVDSCYHCFRRGLAVYPHHPSHPYQVMDSISLPVFDEGWSADEELALLDAVERCGFGNWSEIAACLGKKTEAQCEQHYFMTYLLSPTAPLPDNSRPYPMSTCLFLLNNPDPTIDIDAVIGSDTQFAKEVYKIHKERGGIIGTGNPSDYDSYVQHRQGAGSTVLVDHPQPAPGNPSKSHTGGKRGFLGSGGSGRGGRGLGNKSSAFRGRNTASNDDDRHPTKWKSQLQHFEKASELSRWKAQQFEFKTQQKNNLASVVGYLPQRYDLEIEYLNDAEKDIADMDFRADDTPIERELKLRVLELYNNVLDERSERKEFIDRYQLLIKREKRMSKEEKEVLKSLRPFARYLEPEEFDEFVRCVVAERALRFRIEQLQTYRMNGIQTLADGMLFDQEQARVQRMWDLKYRKKYIEMSAIPVGQNTTVEQALKEAEARQEENAKKLKETMKTHSPITPGPGDDDMEDDELAQSVKGETVGNGVTSSHAKGETTQEQQQQPTPSPFNMFSANSSPPESTQPTKDTGFVTPVPTNEPKLCPCHPKVPSVCHFNLTKMPHYDQLSPAEQLLCIELHFTPAFYLTIKNKLIKECVSHGYVTKGVARSIIKIDVHCADRLLNFCVSNNIVNENTPQ